MTPCTFWNPMPLQSLDCFSSEEVDDTPIGVSSTIFVNYRPPKYNDKFCPCRWPCTPHFDKIQNCRVNRSQGFLKTSSDSKGEALYSEGNPLRPVHMPHYQAMQLCRGMYEFLDSSAPIKVDSIPIRIVALGKERDPIKDCVTWKYSPCNRGKNSGQRGGINKVEPQITTQIVENVTLGVNNAVLTTTPAPVESKRRRKKRDDDSTNDEVTNELATSTPDCGVWEQVEAEDRDCIPETLAEKVSKKKKSSKSSISTDNILQNIPPCTKWPCFLTQHEMQLHKKNATDTKTTEGKKRGSSPNYEKGPGCNCDWPCLPFFDHINKCYNDRGKLLVDANGKPIILPRRFSRTQKQLVLCLSYLEKDEIDCFVKK
ncbi:uncharacterized protein LOC118434693 [Folsomia candida]|nr:uncharacterized protein LOC118434693 [Folsomia candida]